MKSRIALKVLSPVWLPVQVAVITLCLRWAVATPAGRTTSGDLPGSAARATAVSLQNVLPAGEALSLDRPVSVTAHVPRLNEVAGEEPAAVPASPNKSRKMRLLVTAYCPCAECCGKWARHGRTASGKSIRANGGQFVAADTRLLPFHTKLRIPGYAGGQSVPVYDRGGKIKGRRLDVFFPSHAQAQRWGKRWLTCEVLP
jgi:3D (Asp-Asp-Asp) domain-containing protein